MDSQNNDCNEEAAAAASGAVASSEVHEHRLTDEEYEYLNDASHNAQAKTAAANGFEVYGNRLNDDLEGFTGNMLEETEYLNDDSHATTKRSDSQTSILMPLPTPNTLRHRSRPKNTDKDERNGHTSSSNSRTTNPSRDPSSLDFERVVNEYSIQATRDRIMVEHQDQQEEDRKPLLKPTDDTAYNTFADNDASPPPLPPPGSPGSVASSTRKRFLWTKRKSKLGYTGRTMTRWILVNATGVLTGLISILIVSCTDAIGKGRSDLLDYLWRKHGWSELIFLCFAASNLCLALLSASLCLFLAPEAVGSGIPEIIAYLNGARVKRFTSARLLFVKIVATILSVSSGLTLGPEGPLVHIGAILGASCTKLSNFMLQILPRSYFLNRPRLWSFVTVDLSHFSVDRERRDLVSIGSACGFAAAFGAPIGGLLFSMEEASTFYDQSMFLKTLSASALATFCLAVHHGNLSDYSIISLGNFHTANDQIFINRFEEVPLYVLVAVCGGVLGGIFCRCFKFLQLYKKEKSTQIEDQIAWKFLEVTFVSLLTSILTYYAPLMKWVCRPIDDNDDLVANDIKEPSDAWKFHAHQFNCPHANINELATIFFGSREQAISDILTDPEQFQLATLLTVGCIFFPLLTLTVGVSLPSGIFMPTFLIGSSLGGAAGIAFKAWIPALAPSTFALLGAAALLAGIQRNTVSLCVILVEGTGQVKILIPVIVTVVIARYVGDQISHSGLYETAIEINRYPVLGHGEHKSYDIFKVGDIMAAPAVTLGPRERAHTLVKLLRESEHHGFPIVDPFSRKFLGLVRRDQLVALLECGVFDEDDEDGGDDDSSQVSSGITTPRGNWTPKPGVAKSPMMDLAYYIKDDRYDYFAEGAANAANEKLSKDDFDANAWLVSIRRRREYLRDDSRNKPAMIGDDSLPPLRGSTTALSDLLDTRTSAKRETSAETGIFAMLGTNTKGNVYVPWLAPECKRSWVSLGSVMVSLFSLLTMQCIEATPSG